MNGEEVKRSEDTADGISTAIGKLMEHPELISMVAAAMGRSVPANASEAVSATKEATKEAPSEGNQPSADALAAFMPMLSKMSGALGKGSQSAAPHSQLLCALKPYVSENRKTAIDYILKLSQMSTLLDGMK